MVIGGQLEGNGTFEIWDLESGKLKVQGPTVESLTSVAYAPDGKTFATGEPWITAIRDAETGEKKTYLAGKGSAAGPHSLRWDASGSSLIVGQDSACWVYDLASREVVRHLDDSRYYHAFAADERLLVRSHDRNVVRFWEPFKGNLLSSLTIFGHEQPVALAVSPNGHHKMVGQFDDEIVYTVLTEDGHQETLSADEFAEKYGWKNAPDKVQWLPTAE